MLQNAYFLAKIGADTAENEQHFAEISQFSKIRKPGHTAVRAAVAKALPALVARVRLRG